LKDFCMRWQISFLHGMSCRVATRVMLTCDDAFGCLIVSTRPGFRLKTRWENSWPGFGGALISIVVVCILMSSSVMGSSTKIYAHIENACTCPSLSLERNILPFCNCDFSVGCLVLPRITKLANSMLSCRGTCNTPPHV
jgi:hypothetical protein